jgi:hypothetical protein
MLGKASLGMAVLVLAASISAAAPAQQQPASPPPPPAGPGLKLIEERCGSCHNTDQVFVAHKAASEWAGTVQQMIDRGADLDPDEQKTVVAYLAANFATPPAAGAPAPTAPPTPQQHPGN